MTELPPPTASPWIWSIVGYTILLIAFSVWLIMIGRSRLPAVISLCLGITPLPVSWGVGFISARVMTADFKNSPAFAEFAAKNSVDHMALVLDHTLWCARVGWIGAVAALIVSIIAFFVVIGRLRRLALAEMESASSPPQSG